VYEADAAPGTLVCLSHVRWIFVYQRPQHLLSRAARTHKVILIEEPIFRTACEPLLDVCPDPSGVTVVTPVLRHGECIDKLLKVLFAAVPGEPLVLCIPRRRAIAGLTPTHLPARTRSRA
jgi:hypothetical protein